MIRSEFDLPSLFADLEAARAGRSWTRTRLAAAVGVSASTIARSAAGGVMEADGVLAMVGWLGVPPEKYLRPAPVGPGIPLPTVEGRRLRADTAAIFGALDGQRAARSMSWAEVAAELESPRLAAGFQALRRGGRTDIATLVSAAQWLACPIAALTYAADR